MDVGLHMVSTRAVVECLKRLLSLVCSRRWSRPTRLRRLADVLSTNRLYTLNMRRVFVKV